jgi:hypothetical protein
MKSKSRAKNNSFGIVAQAFLQKQRGVAMLRKSFSISVCLVAQFAVCSCHGFAAEPVNHATVLGPYVNDDTLAAAYVDIASLNAANMGELFALVPKLPQQAQAEMVGFMMISTWAKGFQDAGGHALYAVMGLGDIYRDGGPLVIATTRPGKHPEDVEKMMRNVIAQIHPSQVERPLIRRSGDTVLIGTKPTLDRYSRFQPAPRNELITPLTKSISDGAVAALVFCPGADYRRVSRELWPDLPGALAPLRGELADRWRHFEAAINLPPNAKPRITLQAKDAEAAAIFVKLFHDLPAAVDSLKGFGTPPPELKQTLQTIVDAVPPQQDGARVTMTLSMDEKQLAMLRQFASRATDSAMESSRRKKRMNQFKQIALGMLNYESAHKTYPPAAIRDKDGKPLLSWRVAILPYMEEGDLYKQFHLDEPWDSPHNRVLIEKMPESYADISLKQLANEGKTTYQVPTGPKTVFHTNAGTAIRDITDGTSQTILLVEVEPQRAVVWTKPEDWGVDMEHPRRGVDRDDRKIFVAARCDGSVHAVPTSIDEKMLRALLTRAGREVIDQP